MPCFAQYSTKALTPAAPLACPTVRGMWRFWAQRPLPSMMMAMCWGKVDEACVDTNFWLSKWSQARYRLSLKSEAFDYLLEMTNLEV
jgi:hypothetical protein